MMRRDLRQLAQFADPLPADVGRLQAYIAALIADDGPQEPRSLRPRKARVPVPSEIRTQRLAAWSERFMLAVEVGMIPTKVHFAIRHNLSVSLPSRWLTARA